MRPLVIAALVPVILSVPGFAQSTSSPTLAKEAANAWMQSVKQGEQPGDSSLSGTVRSSRDAYFDAMFGAPVALTAAVASHAHIGRKPLTADVTKLPELPPVPGRTVVTGMFSGFTSVISNSHRSIYTEIRMMGVHAFEDPSGTITDGSTITVAIPGGTLQAGKETLSYLTDPEDFFIQPGKRYLLVLTYHSDGAFYSLVKDWELSDGVVKPNSQLEQKRASTGKATLAGLSETSLPTSLAQLFSSEKKATY